VVKILEGSWWGFCPHELGYGKYGDFKAIYDVYKVGGAAGSMGA